ncbi:helix-turn-helix domain-containing protein [Aquimarina litoralis]|uniref:helix-turn-helix domain-containing protein n=1 Tax=Aquimarina litoralis TaxID=584605 RepID=UPI001C58C266|nr:helix-turn-helix domain-containing protein [Aquimarina litoralis]MBW1295057.1 helix-turn-helix domain-containing protein [Aquimarina litoralis]
MEGKIEFIESIGKIVVFTMLLLSVFLFTVKTKNKVSNRLFGIYLLVIAFDLTGLFSGKILEYPNLNALKVASSLLQLPLFYLYVLSACYSNFKIIIKHSIHGLLFVLFWVLFVVTKFSNWVTILYEIVVELQFIGYIMAVFIALKKYKTIYLENYSSTKAIIYKWLFNITLFSCIAHSFVVFRWYLANSTFQEYLIYVNILISISVLLITVYFALSALYKPEIFTGININIEPLASQQKGAISKKITTSENDALLKLEKFMNSEKPYLDFELTLQKLATQIDIPEKSLSLLINRHLDKHFFDFINSYRIEEAKHLLRNETLTIQQIMYEVGFNSKSSFNTAFKKHTSETPSNFRKSVN